MHFLVKQDFLMIESLAQKKGDFLVDDKYTFEVGGKNKDFFTNKRCQIIVF